MTQSRIWSWPLWLAVAGLAFIVLTEVCGLQIDEGLWNKVLDGIGVVLIGFGIMNNPTNPVGFGANIVKK